MVYSTYKIIFKHKVIYIYRLNRKKRQHSYFQFDRCNTTDH